MRTVIDGWSVGGIDSCGSLGINNTSGSSLFDGRPRDALGNRDRGSRKVLVCTRD